MKRKLYVDLDGVVADFEAKYNTHFGPKDGRVTPEQWKEIHKIEDFFFEIPVMRGAKMFMAAISKYDPEFLTAAPKSNFQHVAKQKIKWRDRHFPTIHLIPSYGGENKHLYMRNRGDILLDDTPHVCDHWLANGGMPVLFEGDYEKALETIERKMR